MTTTSGPDFVSFQVRDLQASADFYEKHVGMRRLPAPNPHAEVFSAGGSTFAVRTLLPGTDLDSLGQPGVGIAVWFHHEDPRRIHEALVALGTPIVQEPFEGPFGLTFSFRDPDGYVVTLHSRA
ncbi:VOC family protein [Demequina capsici]|uniref:VOC family protein n=1 Tax=Demequina capsici TaxID=3075620 RepID=A0AA96F7C4_9MICO|nr:VOC family protein [Demequina sp. OYTSA14]WNM25143.1 VOC family protein [Demequina sp. OYTSA14]